MLITRQESGLIRLLLDAGTRLGLKVRPGPVD